MRRILLSAFLIAAIGVAHAGEPARYGKPLPETAAVPVAEAIAAYDAHAGKPQRYSGRITQVCQAEGCWIKVERKDGTAMLVRAKDHAFLMPSNIVGKTVLIDGSATVKETTEAQRRHYAEDAGKSKEEITSIKGSEIAVEFSARGVKVLD